MESEMSEPTWNQALSILNQIEAEYKTWEAQRRGFMRVRELLEKAMIAEAMLDGLEKMKQGLTDP